MTDDELLFELSRNDVLSCRISYADGGVVVGHGLLLEAAGLINREQAENKRLRAAVRTANDEAEHFERKWYLREERIDELALENTRLKAWQCTCLFRPHSEQIAALSADVATLQSELDRYQWMRDNITDVDLLGDSDNKVKLWIGPKVYCGSTLEATIDAARAALGDKS